MDKGGAWVGHGGLLHGHHSSMATTGPWPPQLRGHHRSMATTDPWPPRVPGHQRFLSFRNIVTAQPRYDFPAEALSIPEQHLGIMVCLIYIIMHFVYFCYYELPAFVFLFMVVLWEHDRVVGEQQQSHSWAPGASWRLLTSLKALQTYPDYFPAQTIPYLPSLAGSAPFPAH